MNGIVHKGCEISGDEKRNALLGVVEHLEKREVRTQVIKSGEIPMKFKGLDFIDRVNGRTYVLEDEDFPELAALWDECFANSEIKNEKKRDELKKIGEVLRK